MLRIVILLVATVFLALADGSVLQTGQTLSYNADGNVVTDGSIKDDGYYRTGAVRSYSRSGGVVIDNTTGLEWQDNVESVQKPWDEFEGDTAATQCAILDLGGHDDWRLPSIRELQTLADSSQYDPAITEGGFNHIFSDYYWSSTVVGSNTSDSAWAVGFLYGHSSFGDESENLYVRCVRGEGLYLHDWSRSDEIVTDNATGLQWQDDSVVATETRTWTEAIDYCEKTLTLGGYSDWRLPNKNELLSIVDYDHLSPALSSIFQTVPLSSIVAYYWSSTSEAQLASNAFIVDFRFGMSVSGSKNVAPYVRCVRGGQVNIPINPSIIMYLLN